MYLFHGPKRHRPPIDYGGYQRFHGNSNSNVIVAAYLKGLNVFYAEREMEQTPVFVRIKHRKFFDFVIIAKVIEMMPALFIRGRNIHVIQMCRD